ncbi:DNA repair protein rad2 [Scheffersomyces spartinae]|uniref:DNA repair protein rad2 n=1 Tax=Scheffersomyces spartinae TaxID=45513 RepID=A0A9P7V8F7_9ASCO|nr:DNA repair protein rad2 [Scheffersomyces spartinae]KAG7193142.1 DNA repair protein rad2 [Scheffersomyces spartinae]
MGVHSLWTILGPTARPVKLESLLRKKLAVDGSIWIYQFLKAVRDDKGDVLPHAHIVGFFRRICKLLYHGIYPILVFDGGAPALKRDTIRKRQDRRLGNRDTVNTAAKKLLAIQLRRLATGGGDKGRKRKAVVIDNNVDIDEDDSDSDQVYFEDLQNLNMEKNYERTKPFRREDDYHLPGLRSFKVSTNDTRILPGQEYDENGNFDFDMVDGIDINTIDPSSKQFHALPKATQYMILSHLRLKSRLRMGFDKDQLETMFPDEMEFSKFQINQVQKRNFFTQRLMEISGMGDDGNVTKRVAGEKDREYSLVRNDDGWTLSLVKDHEGSTLDKPITLEEDEGSKQGLFKKRKIQTHDSDDDDSLSDFDEVPLVTKPEPVEHREEQEQFLKSLYDKYEVPKIERPSSAPICEVKDGFSFSQSLLAGPIETEVAVAEEVTLQDDVLGDGKRSSDIKRSSSTERLTATRSTAINSPRAPVTGSNNILKEQIKSSESAKSQILNHPTTEPSNYAPLVKEFKSASGTNGQADGDKSVVVTISEVKVAAEDEESGDDGQDEEQLRRIKQSEQNQLPQWFKEDFTITNPHQEVAYYKETIIDEDKELKDELIPWKEAQTMLEKAESSDESDVYDVQEIQDPSKIVVPEHVISIEEASSGRKPMVFDYDFEEDEELDLVRQMNSEEADHEKFRQELAGNESLNHESINSVVTDEQLLQEQLQKAKRDSDEVTDTMIKGVQELLRRFGIPYITAPMEAEAQCAELLKLKLVDGIITDDSDCFLFGGDRIYKNMFNQKQYVECYQMADIEGQLGLTQERLIELAMLLGSDYTEGVSGIGPVLAMEILAEFGSVKEFKKWFDKNTQTIVDDATNNNTTLKKSLLSRIKNGKLFLAETFPDSAISNAYKHPEVDHDDTQFKWGIPDLDQVRSFLMYNVKWSQQKVDDVMVPLIRDMNKRRTMQTTLEEFFPRDLILTRKELASGKRIKKAAAKLTKK